MSKHVCIVWMQLYKHQCIFRPISVWKCLLVSKSLFDPCKNIECVWTCVGMCVCVSELEARLPGTRWYGVMLRRPTDKLIHLLTLLTRLSDFVKWTIDQASSLSLLSLPVSRPLLLSLHFPHPPRSLFVSCSGLSRAGLLTSAPRIVINIITHKLVFSSKGARDYQDVCKFGLNLL